MLDLFTQIVDVVIRESRIKLYSAGFLAVMSRRWIDAWA